MFETMFYGSMPEGEEVKIDDTEREIYDNMLRYETKITYEGSVPKMRIWSILLIISDSKWCIHFSTQQKVQHTFTVRKTYIKRTLENVR